jgi:hypothetical protein
MTSTVANVAAAAKGASYVHFTSHGTIRGVT